MLHIILSFTSFVGNAKMKFAIIQFVVDTTFSQILQIIILTFHHLNQIESFHFVSWTGSLNQINALNS